MASPAPDIYEILEREVRTPKESLLLDAFLPPPATLPSAVARPAPSPPRPAVEAGEVPEPGAPSVLRQMLGAPAPGEAAEPPHHPPAARRRRQPEPSKSLEDEVAEFMSLRGGALAPDTDPES